jgi:undecaprenyl-diphosphatase
MNAFLSYVNASDLRVSHRLSFWRPPRWFRLWMRTATRLGDGWLGLLVGITFLFSGDRGYDAFGAAAVSAAVTNCLLVVLKKRFRRLRPCEHKYTAQFAADEFSFPSGHSMNAFAFATVVALAFPPFAGLAFVAAASVAASRVFLGLHFVTDVLVGALLGLLIGTSAAWLVLG